MKIIITGATGSLGGVLTRYFSKQGHEVIGTGKMVTPPALLTGYANYICTDITETYSLPDADVCIHTAALSDDKGTKEALFKANVIGTRNTIQAASSCKVFIHISSSSVYLPSPQPLTEATAGKQNNRQLSPYGFSKLMTEQMLQENIKHPSCFILRPRAHYGPGDKVILPRLLKLIKGDEIHRPGGMQITISMTHYDNLIHAIECCLRSERKGINIYNVSDDRQYVFIEMFRKLTQALYGHELKEKEISILLMKILALFKIGGITPLLVRSFTKNMVLDISKIKRELSYQPIVDFENSLPELVQWVRQIGGIEIIRKANKDLAWEV